MMARLLFMTSKEKGHVNPMLPVARHLRERGHHVGWRCLPYAPPRLEEMGFDVEASAKPQETEGESLATSGPELVRLVRDDQRLLEWIRRLLIEEVPAQIEPTRRAFRRWEPDILVVDPMLYQGIIAADLEGVTYACVSSSLNPVTPDDLDCRHTHNMRSLAEERRQLFAHYDMAPTFKVADCLSPYLNIVFATRDYIGDDIDIPEATHLVGPTHPTGRRGDEPNFDWDWLDDRPLIYASFGSQIYHLPERFASIAEATRPLDIQVVISCGELAESRWAETLPDPVMACAYTPQRELLERSDVMITHGGANSVMEALVAGVPMVISPVCNDQPMQAFFARRRGVAVEIDLESVGTDELADTLRRLLDRDGPRCRTIRDVAHRYRELDGAARAADLIEELQ